MDDTSTGKISGLITGYWMSQAIYVAAKLELADRLANGARSVEELADETGTHAPSLYRLLRALASLGVFRECVGERFELTPAAEVLRRGVPGSQWAWAMMMGEEHYFAWGELLHSIQTGQGAFRKQHGMGVFDYLAQHPEQAQIFDEAMTSIHGRETEPMLGAYDFSQFGTICDVGGGNGSLLELMLEEHPSVRGVLFDLPHVIERAKARLADSPVAARLRFESGSFFEGVPPGADAYLMRHIIHDWHDDQCRTILRHCAQALQPGGQVLVIESVIPRDNAWHFGKWLDLNMLVLPEGKERTAEEYQELFASAGLELAEIVPTPGEVSIIVGRVV